MSDPRPRSGDVVEAARRVQAQVRRTPLEHSLALSDLAGVEVLLKLENLQRTGSFKLRGALNAVAALSGAERARGLVAASAGNHGLGVALAARLAGAAATVYVPTEGSRTKRRRIARYGARVRVVNGGYDAAHAEAAHFAEEAGAAYLHAFSDPAVVAGQGTVGLEILEERPDVGALLVPVGGGGLIGGIGVVARQLAPRARVIGVQSTQTAAMHASLAARRPVSPPMGPTLCDGLSGDTDDRSLALARAVVDEVLLVEEAAVAEAIRYLYREEGLVAEGSGAVAVAALLSGWRPATGGPLAVVVSGGNIDAPLFGKVLLRRRTDTTRYARHLDAGEPR